MERIDFFRRTILQLMNEYAASLASGSDGIDIEQVTDKEHDRYQILAVGWEGRQRVFNLLFHLEIMGDKIWVQEDKMEDSVAEMLVAKGVSKKDIVLAYFPDFHRQYTEYAVS